MLFDKVPAHAIILKTQESELYDKMLSEGLVQEVIDGEQIGFQELKQLVYPYRNSGGSFVLIDDSAHLLSQSMSRLFTEGVHHWVFIVINKKKNNF